MSEKCPETGEILQKITGEAREKFELFSALLAEYNRKYNLTSLTEEKDILYKHFLDSAMGEFLFPAGANAVEVGSGAGFPSLPVKILRPDLSFTLVESVGKKCDFLRVAIEKLGLEGVEVVKARAEEVGRSALREKFDVCCARAVARLNVLAEYCLPLVKKGGRFLAYKGDAAEEIAEGKRAIGVLGGAIDARYSFLLPEGTGFRTIVCVSKERPTPAAYPRGRGKERSHPIV